MTLDDSRTVLPIPDQAARRPGHLRRQGPGHVVPADRAAAAAGRGAERADRAARRRRLRRVVARSAVRRDCPTAERLAAGGSEVQPVPHDGVVLADARRRC